MITKIVSGGQTGADTAALDAAIEHDTPYGGWCPKGRINEIGIISEKYSELAEIEGIFENEKENYNTRTKLNIRDSDGTLILVPNIPLPPTIKDGTLLTIEEVKSQKKSFLMIDLSKPQEINIESIIQWLKENNVEVLNVAGPRESSSHGVYQSSLELLKETISTLKSTYVPQKNF